MRPSNHKQVFAFLTREITDYLFFQQIRQAFVNVSMSETNAIAILRNMSNKIIPTPHEVQAYRSHNRRLQVFDRLRDQLSNIADLYVTRQQHQIILPHFDVHIRPHGRADLNVEVRLPGCAISLTTPKALDVHLHRRVLNSSMHRFLLLTCALRYHMVYVRNGKSLTVEEFWDHAPDLVELLDDCRGKKYTLVSADEFMGTTPIPPADPNV